MKNKFSAALCCILIVIGTIINIVTVRVSAENTAVGEIQNFIDGIVEYEKAQTGANSLQEWLDGALADGAGSTSEWYVTALSQYDSDLDFTTYADSLENFLAENQIRSATSRQCCALALIACGRANSAYVSATINDSIGEQGIMSWVYGLHIMNNGVISEKYSVSDVTNKLLSLRLSDGGWAITGNFSDVDVTAMTVHALAPYYSSDADIRSAVDGALDWLGTKQLDDGGYQSYGIKCPESAAQVIVALSAVGIDPCYDERFIKNGNTVIDGMMEFQLSDGSFKHTEDGEYNHTATVQAFYSLVSLRRLENGLGPLYVFDKVNSSETSESTETEKVMPETTSESDETKPSVETETDNTSSYIPESDISAINEEQNEKKPTTKYKLIICLCILVAAFTVCLILWLRGKRNYKNFVFVLSISAAAVCFVVFNDFQTADNYYGGDSVEKNDASGSVTMTIRCDLIVGKSDSEYIPEDGVILPVTEFALEEGDTAYDILVEAAKRYNIQVENEGSAGSSHGMAYISGINYLYEFDFGDLSGWVYRVNGESHSIGCGDYRLSDGDEIEWLYSCELGNDLD